MFHNFVSVSCERIGPVPSNWKVKKNAEIHVWNADVQNTTHHSSATGWSVILPICNVNKKVLRLPAGWNAYYLSLPNRYSMFFF